jgi:hypothetical protein
MLGSFPTACDNNSGSQSQRRTRTRSVRDRSEWCRITDGHPAEITEFQVGQDTV